MTQMTDIERVQAGIDAMAQLAAALPSMAEAFAAFSKVAARVATLQPMRQYLRDIREMQALGRARPAGRRAYRIRRRCRRILGEAGWPTEGLLTNGSDVV